MVEILTASIVSGLIYDGVKTGATISCGLLKSKLQGWLINDSQIEQMLFQLQEAGVNEDLAPHAIERKVTEYQPLMDLIQQIKASDKSVNVNQTSNVGHNINSSGNGDIYIGDITAEKPSE